MPTIQPKSLKQNKALFGLATKRGLSHDDLRDLAAEVSGGRVDHVSLVSFEEANEMIHRLGGDPFDSSRTPRRTVNYRRQQAGVPQIAQGSHLDLMKDLAAKRGISAEGLERLCRRMLKGNPRPRTTAETNKIIEALKAMNERDRVIATDPKEAA